MKIASAHLWVHDQEVALKYWTEKVGMEVRQDVSLPDLDATFRWLTVGPRGQDDVSIVLMAVPGPPLMDEATQKQVLDLTAKGFAGTVFLTTEDCQASYEELKARGVEFTEEPHENALRHRLRVPRSVRQQCATYPIGGDSGQYWVGGTWPPLRSARRPSLWWPR